MYIKKIKLKNFRCFESNEIRFNDRFNLIVGNNGFGKTSVLEAVSIGISAYLNQISDLRSNDKRNIRPEDVRIKRNSGLSEVEEYTEQYPVVLDFESDIDGAIVEYSRIKTARSGSNKYDPNSRIKELSNDLNKVLQQGEKVILPTFVYHGTGRVWAINNDKKTSSKNKRIAGYMNCISPRSNEKQYSNWIKNMRIYELEEETRSVELRTLYKAAERFLGEGTKINYKAKEQQIMVTKPDGEKMPYSQMSDGYKNALGIVFDTAFRMIQLNPWLKEDAIDETPGIILIDEIDLHLHPSWQKKIVRDLKSTFPKMQIIATTHAPIVISSCESNELIILNSELDSNYQRGIEVINSKNNFKGWLAEDVLEHIMEVDSSRDEEVQQMIDELSELYVKKVQNKLNGDEKERFMYIVNYLEERLPSDDPIVSTLGFDILMSNMEG